MCGLSLTLFLILSLPFSWANDFYEAAQTPDPCDDLSVLTADVYVTCETRPAGRTPREVAPPAAWPPPSVQTSSKAYTVRLRRACLPGDVPAAATRSSTA
jgi:hypothetical protein